MTLLNTDFKILGKLIVLRVKPFLEKLIHPSQTGFMQGRNISHNIRKIIDIIEIVDRENIDALLISLDFEKAFDRVERTALNGTFRFCNFGENLIRWINLLYTAFESFIINLGYISNWFKPTRGLHQGAPESTVAFILIFENLGENICNNPNIKGIVIDGYEYKSGQFADDTNLFSLYDRLSLQAVVDTLQIFETNTGLKLNYDKSNVYRIGSLKNSDAKLYTTKTLNWTNESISILGIDITYANKDMSNLNYSKIIEKIRSITSTWNKRDPSLFGRVMIVNQLIASLFVYKMNVLLDIPDYILDQANKIIADFLWKEKTHRIVYDILFTHKKMGGLKVVNLQKKDYALKVQWTQAYHANVEIKILADQLLIKGVGGFIWSANLKVGDNDIFVKKRFLERCIGCVDEVRASFSS